MSDQQEIQIKNTITEGKKIYGDYLRRIRDDEQFNKLGYQARYEYYMKMHIDFARQSPMVLRMIASYGMFNEKAISMYMKKCFNCPIKTDEDYCERQADFVKYNYMFNGKHKSQKELNEIWQQSKKSMMDEIKATNQEKKKISEQRSKNKESN